MSESSPPPISGRRLTLMRILVVGFSAMAVLTAVDAVRSGRYIELVAAAVWGIVAYVFAQEIYKGAE